MALIKCPECGREVSDRVQTCIHCGYPIPKPKVTLYNVSFDPNTKMTWRQKSDARAFVYPYAEKRLGGDWRAATADAACLACPGGCFVGGLTQAEANRIADEARARGFKVVIGSYVSEQNSSVSATTDNKPRCPTCRSERVGPISQASKVQAFIGDGSIGRSGINNPYFGKSYECYNCGYRW